MKTKIFSVYDSKAECFGTPFFMPNRAMAIRVFSDLAKDKQSMVGKHREDFMLYEVGEFNDENGDVINQKPVNLGIAVLEIPEVIDLGKTFLKNGVETEKVVS